MISVSESRFKQYSSQSSYDTISNSLPNLQYGNGRRRNNEVEKPRSMRTIRSKFHQTSSSSSCESSLSVVSLHMQRVSDDCDDAGSESSSCSSAVGLDLSQTFSEVSAYSSDVSGELIRLATAPSSPLYYPNPNPNPNPNRDSSKAARRSLHQLAIMNKLSEAKRVEEGNSNSDSNSHNCSSEFLNQEELRMVVKLLVQDLDNGNGLETQRKAATELRYLAKNKTENRELIAKEGGIWPLVSLVGCSDPQTQEAAVTALLNMSLCDENKMEITRAGAIKPLITVLKMGTSVAKQNAACALLSLSLVDDNKFCIGAAGAIPPLVALLINGSCRGKKDAATTLYSLSSVYQNKERIVKGGAVKPLLELMADPTSDMVDKAVVILSNLASVPDGKNAIVTEGGIPVLVDTLEIGSRKGKEFCVVTLARICQDSYFYRMLVSREGAIPPLVDLSQNGTSRARKKATLLLQYLREPQSGLE